MFLKHSCVSWSCSVACSPRRYMFASHRFSLEGSASSNLKVGFFTLKSISRSRDFSPESILYFLFKNTHTYIIHYYYIYIYIFKTYIYIYIYMNGCSIIEHPVFRDALIWGWRIGGCGKVLAVKFWSVDPGIWCFQIQSQASVTNVFLGYIMVAPLNAYEC